jgi:hypothetical protein
MRDNMKSIERERDRKIERERERERDRKIERERERAVLLITTFVIDA